MKLRALTYILFLLFLGLTFEGFLRYSDWSDKDVVEGWGKLRSLKSGSSFTPNQSAIIAGTEFKINSAGERDANHPIEKLDSDIRIGVFGGLNVLGFTLSGKNTLAEFMKINPAPICELQGRNCVYYNYGRIDLLASDAAKLIQDKIKADSLDIAVWIMDPFSEAANSIKVPWTSSLAINWLLAPLSWRSLQRGLKSTQQTTTQLAIALPELRQFFISSQKDLIPVVLPAMDRDISSQTEWELAASSAFFNNGFLPVRAKSLIQEKTRASLALRQTGLLGDEALRALASLIRERIEKSPHMRAHQ